MMPKYTRTETETETKLCYALKDIDILQARIKAAVAKDALGGISSTCLVKWDPACGTCNVCLAKKAYKILTSISGEEDIV